MNGIACANVSFTHGIAGEILYSRLQEKGAKYENKKMDIILADGSHRNVEVNKTKVYLNIERYFIRTVFIALPSANDNRILFRNGFLREAVIVLDVTSTSSEILRKNPNILQNIVLISK